MIRSYFLPLLFLSLAEHGSGTTPTCQFPVQLPEVRDAQWSRQAPAGAPVASVTVRSRYRVVHALWWVSDRERNRETPEYWSKPIFPVTPASSPRAGNRVSAQALPNGDYKLTLFAVKRIYAAGAEIFFDIGCTQLSIYIQPRPASATAAPFRPGRLLQFAQPNVQLSTQSYTPLTFQYERDAMDARYRFQYAPMLVSYRDSRGMWAKHPDSDSNFPLRVDNRNIVFSSGFENNKWRATYPFKATSETRDVIMAQSVEFVAATPGSNLEIYQATFILGFYTSIQTRPMINVRVCDKHYDPPEYVFEDAVVVPKEANRPGCLMVEVDGNPLPEWSVVEVSTNRSLQFEYPLPKRLTYDAKIFATPALAKGEMKQYQILAWNADGETTRTRLVVAAYVPPRLEVWQSRRVIDGPVKVTLKCSVDEPVTNIGFYFVTNERFLTNPQLWKKLKGVRSDDQNRDEKNATLLWDVGQARRRVRWIEFATVFCGVKHRYLIAGNPEINFQKAYDFEWDIYRK